MRLPFRDGGFDVCYSSNVLEHVREPWRMADEMLRVTMPGGIVFLSTPSGTARGAATRPRRGTTSAAATRAGAYARKHGREPKNRYGESLFAVTVARRARAGPAGRPRATCSTVLPRYNPRWTCGSSGSPVLRELVTWNLVIVLRKR